MLNYVNPEPHLLTNPVGIDREIQRIQVKLKDNLSWLQVSFGRSFKQESLFDTDKVRYERRHYYPECYLQNMEPINVMPNDNLRSASFFYTEDPAILQGEYVPNQPNIYAYDVSLVVWANLETIAPEKDWRYTEELKRDVMRIVSTFFSVKVVEIYDTWLGTLENYTVNDNFKQSTRPPYTGFRIKMSINVKDLTVCQE